MSSNDEKVPLSLQSLPQELRIWFFENYVTAEDLQTLRGVSKLFKFEIDQRVGLKKNVKLCDESSETTTESRTGFLRSVALQEVTLELNSQTLLDIRNILPRPSKLRHCAIGGRIRRQLLHSLLSSASNLSSLSVTGLLLAPSTTTSTIFDKLLETEEAASRHFLPRLKSLEVSLRQESALEVLLTSEEVLRSISASRLSKFDLKIDFQQNTVPQIFRTIIEFVTFVDAHPSLVSISISFVGKGINIPVEVDADPLTQECRSLYKSATRLLSQFKKSIQLGRFAKLEEFLLESNSHDLNAKDVARLFVEALESPGRNGNMKKLGFKIRDLPNWERTYNTLTSYHETLREIFIESRIFSAIDFRSFGVCENLESFSIHDTKWRILGFDDFPEERSVVVLSNVGEGLELLEKLRVFIVNGLVLSRADVVALSVKPLRVLGLQEVAWTNFASYPDFIVPSRPVDLLGGAGGDGGDAFLSGIPLEAVVNMLSNRHLEALLVDLHSYFATSLRSGRDFRLTRERLSGNIRKFDLDISASEDKHVFPYWKFRGSSVEFPFF